MPANKQFQIKIYVPIESKNSYLAAIFLKDIDFRLHKMRRNSLKLMKLGSRNVDLSKSYVDWSKLY